MKTKNVTKLIKALCKVNKTFDGKYPTVADAARLKIRELIDIFLISDKGKNKEK